MKLCEGPISTKVKGDGGGRSPQRSRQSIPAGGAPPTATGLLELQRLAGNRAVLVQLRGQGTKQRRERQRHEKVRLWAERIQPRVPGLSKVDAVALCDGLVDQPVSVNDAEAFAQLVVEGWSAPQVAALGRKYAGSRGSLSRSHWLRVAAPLVDQPDAAAGFARLAHGWSATGCIGLAAAFAQGDGGTGAQDWVRMARLGGPLLDQPADVAAFARAGGWNPGGRVALAGLYAATASPRLAREWVSIATAAPGLATHAADVAEFARVPAPWSAPKLAGLAARYAGAAGGRSAADWVALASAHANLANEDEVVAQTARAAWTPAGLGQVVTAALAAGAPWPAFATFLSAGPAAAGVWPMVTGGWAAPDLGTFLGRLLQGGASGPTIVNCLTTPNMVAATLNMRGSWSAAGLAGFIRGAINRSTPYATLATLLATPNFPASSRALLTGTWTAVKVGEFATQSAVAGASGAQIHSLTSTANVPARLRAMTAAGWSEANLATFTVAMRLAPVPVPASTIAALMQLGPFRTGSLLMHGAGWRPKTNGEFVAGAIASGLANNQLAAMVNHAGFAAAAKPWLAPGWTASEMGRICGQARRQSCQLPSLTSFLGTANTATSAAALKPTWGADEVGETVGYCLTRNGAPTSAEMERLLFLAQTAINGAQIQPAHVREAALATTSGPPTWANVIAHIPTFQAAYQGVRVNGDGPTVTLFLGGYHIRLKIPGERINHVEKGHTFEHFLFSYANCTRPGVWLNQFCTFFPTGTSVLAKLQAIQGDGAMHNLAQNAAQNAHLGTGLATQGVAQGCTVAAASYPPTPGGVSNAIISQCYPNAGTQIRGKDLVAIGRYFFGAI